MLTTILLVSIFTYLLYRSVARPKNFPPGPTHVPILGYAGFFKKGANREIVELARKHGDIIGFNALFRRTVVLTSAAAVREAFKDDVFNGKPQTYAMQMRSGGSSGMVTTEGNTWRQLRRFTLHVLRDFGLGKTSIEAIIQEEVRDLINQLRSHSNQSVNLKKYLEKVAVNALWVIATGERFKQDDPKITQIRDALTRLSGTSSVGRISFFIPYKKWIPPSWIGLQEAVGFLNDLHSFVKDVIQKHMKNKDKQGNNDYIYNFLAKMEETTDKTSVFYGETGMNNLVQIISEFFSGGTLSTSDTITWFLLILCYYPDIQKKIQNEIDLVLGTNEPTYSDLKRMPYTHACLLEVQRYSSVVSTVIHRTTADTTIRGYFVPKDTTVLANLYAVFHDPKVWEKPDDFYPGHYLDEHGCVKNEEHHIPFSAGKRFCPGESLAKYQIALVSIGLLQNFDFTFSPDEPRPPLETKASHFRICPKHKLLVTRRK